MGEPSVVVYTYDPSTQEAEIGRSEVQGQPGLCSENLSQKPKEDKNQKISKDWDVDQWYSTCLACAWPYVQSPALQEIQTNKKLCHQVNVDQH
jgi:hypothetical protein